MKRFLYFILVLFFSDLILFCQKVDPSTAKKVAIANFQKHNLTGNPEVSEIVPLGLKNDTLIYIVKFVKKGFVIVSSYYAAPPILGQCYTDAFDTSKMPPGLLYLLEKYKYEMLGIKENKLKPTKEVESKWNKILSGEYNSTKSYNIESILVPTRWNQWDIYQDEDHPVFCTGVAMAQILYYYKCRVTGPSTYYWNNMDLYSSDAENGLLLYDCSKECESSIFSGSSTPGLARDALVDHFGINSSADVKWRIWHLSNWEGMLKDEIDLERPILYSGGNIIPPYGHSWVIDGYNEDDEFNCNWGWGGSYDDFYSLGNFSNPNGSFNEFESAIFNIVPNQALGVAIPELTAQSFAYSSNGYTLNVPEAFGASSYEWITDHGTISGSGTSVTLNSPETANVQVRAYNELCEIYSSYNSETITINYGPISGSSYVCSSGTEYTINNLPSGATITWSSSENITRISAQGSNPCTFQPNTEGYWGTISATITFNNVGYELAHKDVWVGLYNPPTGIISYESSLCKYTDLQFYIDLSSNPNPFTATYNWRIENYLNADITVGQGTLSIYVYPYESGSLYFSVVAENECGLSSRYFSDEFVIDDCYLKMVLSPNPASDRLKIKLPDNSTGIATLEIINSQGVKVISTSITGNEETIDISRLPKGLYYISVFSNSKGKSKINTERFIKE